MTRDQRQCLFLGHPDGEHRAVTASTFVHVACSQNDDASTFFETENSSHARRGDLTDTVTDDG
jgi:hypothetical protein